MSIKRSTDIVKWGCVKPFFDKTYNFNSIDVETVENELFLLGYIQDDIYRYVEEDFYETFNHLLLESVRSKKDILTWSRYDNTHLLKLILKDCININDVLLRIGKLTPIYTYHWRYLTITLVNIIKDSMIFTLDDGCTKPKNITIYNLKNLYTSGLESVAKSYKIDYYSKMGIEYHIIDKKRFKADLEYKKGVLLSNELDNKVIIDIAYQMLENFKRITGNYPKSIFTAGSIARSYLLSYKELDVEDLNFKYKYGKNKEFKRLLDYSMQSYHGGKIESYVLGYIKKAKIIDISSAYPYAFSKLPKLTDKVYYRGDGLFLNDYYYAFIHCDIYIGDPNLIHPIVVINPVNNTNISPCGWCENVVITKVEYDYLIKNNCQIDIHDYIAIEHEKNCYPYENLIVGLFESRLKAKSTNMALSDLFKTIINSLYGITFELTDVFDEKGWIGYRSGDFFNPILASYITAYTRTYLSEVSYNVIENGGEVFLNMTDSIIYDGEVTLDVFSDKKTLGKFEPPTEIKDVVILGAGRYEYYDNLKKAFTIKNRGFEVSIKNESFYRNLDLNDRIILDRTVFVSAFKATTDMYSSKELGYLLRDDYVINPFNLGGKRIVENRNINLNKEYTRTLPIELEKGII
jgi:hypothetical protein